MNTYLMIGEHIGTAEARDLAQQLRGWHDAMVSHLRAAARQAATCGDDCPHGEARSLWAVARNVFGTHADGLEFLRRHGARAPDPRMG